MPKEKGYLVCRKGRLLIRQNDTEGGEHNVDIIPHCSKGEPVALVHTHNVNPNPSDLDLKTAKERRLIVCVDFRGRVTCYQTVGKES